MPTSVLWLRRDLRLADHPALLAAASDGPVVPLFVVDPGLWRGAPARRRARLVASLRALDTALQQRYAARLVVRHGSPEQVVTAVAAQARASAVHVTAETTPYGRRRDARVRARLERAGVGWVATGTAYAVGPGTLLTGGGTAYRVFTPFASAWRAHGAPGPAPLPARLSTVALDSEPLPEVGDADLVHPITGEPGWHPAAGEAAALERWAAVRDGSLAAYRSDRDRPDLDGTSLLSQALKHGELHPRTLIADLAGRTDDGARTFVTELAWREFYADVLWHHPRSAWQDLRPLGALTYDEPDERFAAWREGRTGFPFVDAGMRQLAASGWLHNRVRMVVASFLIKDLHVWWPHGARAFAERLLDLDLASNAHGWQWCAGTGTDAAPYFRVFNPVAQGRRFDPAGDYVRRWVPELRGIPGAAVHEPWAHAEGYAAGYPERIVDHAAERLEALRRYAAR